MTGDSELLPATVSWDNDAVVLVDQRLLPAELRLIRLETVEQVATAIRDMAVRGAPAIGVTAALGMVLAARAARGDSAEQFRQQIMMAAEQLRSTRPTAVNLFWAIDRMIAVLTAGDLPPSGAYAAGLDEAMRMLDEDIAANHAIGRHGLVMMPQSGSVLTHCNAGALATAGYGTALGVIRAAWDAGRQIHVWIDETRPRLQGARLTAWECSQLKIPATLISDNVAPWLMRQGRIQVVVVGADRIAANGDTANKIGTYGVAVAARAHEIPFYVAAPLSTVDWELDSGAEIPIEERSPMEVLCIEETVIAPEGMDVHNPAFDVTPAALISGIITEYGVATPPFKESLARLRAGAGKDRIL